MIPIESKNKGFTVSEKFKMLFDKNYNKNLIVQASKDEFLAESCKKDLLKKLK